MSGVYLLNLSRARIAWWAPLAVLFTDRGLRYTLLAALFFAPSVVTIKWPCSARISTRARSAATWPRACS
jgi:hypothetical protein